MTDPPTWMTFPNLAALEGFKHRFTLRHPEIDVQAERAEVLQRLWAWHQGQVAEMGFDAGCLCIAEQVHGKEVAVVESSPPEPIRATDGMVTAATGLVLGIYVADCCAVFLADPVAGACGLVHSGKKGSELGIAGEAIRLMSDRFGSDPGNIRVQLSPCIRPPAYEIDFAEQIRVICHEAGILPGHLSDDGVCTSGDTQRFYSYRLEKGRTGRMLALIGRRPNGTRFPNQSPP